MRPARGLVDNFVVERDPESNVLVGYVPAGPVPTARAPTSTSCSRTCARSSRCCSRTAAALESSSSTCAPSRSRPWAACRSSSLGRSALCSRRTVSGEAPSARLAQAVPPPRWSLYHRALPSPWRDIAPTLLRKIAADTQLAVDEFLDPGERRTQQANQPDSLRSQVTRGTLGRQGIERSCWRVCQDTCGRISHGGSQDDEQGNTPRRHCVKCPGMARKVPLQRDHFAPRREPPVQSR